VEEFVMSDRLGPIEVYCDAPPYPIVRACQEIGFRNPEDVRWLRLRHVVDHHPWWGISPGHPWKLLLGRAKSVEKTCSCGEKLPRLCTGTFTLNTGEELTYRLGQCRRCWTVFWDEA
jgi:hypothetical protein